MSIIIVAPEDDLHARVVAERLSDLGVDSRILNTTWFPWKSRIAWQPTDCNLYRDLAGDIDLKAPNVIWWRRFRNPTSSPTISDELVRDFCFGESVELLRGCFTTANATIINNPSAEKRSASKPYQLKKAHECGLPIPATLVSNDRATVVRFIRSVPRAIVKTLVCDYPHSVATREISAEAIGPDCEVGLAPAIYQELVEAVADIRVCVVGNDVFAAELRREAINDEVDWRMTEGGWVTHEMDETTESLLLTLTRELELATCSFDLRLRDNGDYVFLEANPSGQFLFLEIDAGLPVSQGFANLLQSQVMKLANSSPD